MLDGTGALAILTRPQGRNETLAASLRDAGLAALALPALSVQAVAWPPARLPRPDQYDLLVFVSSTAARFYLDQLARAQSGPWPAHTLAAAVGRASAKPLFEAGTIPPSHILHPGADALGQDSEALWAVLGPRMPAIKRVLIVRGQSGREWLGQRLELAGAQVRRYAVYRREPQAWTPEQAAALRNGLRTHRPAICLVTSSEGADAIHANVQRHQLGQLWESVRFVTIHQRVASRLQFRFATTAQQARAPRVQVCPPDDLAIFQAIQSAAS